MPVAHMILAFLDHVDELHGYTIKELVSLGSWSFPITSPPVYPTLARMQKAGWVTQRSEVVSGRHRKLYAITRAGRAELVRWIGDPKAMPVGRGAWRDPMLFRIRMLDSGGLEQARAWLREGIGYWEAYIAQGGGTRPIDPIRRRARRTPKYMPLAIQWGVEQARLRVRFYRQVLEEIEKDLAAKS